MQDIKTIERHIFNGKEYKSLPEIKTVIENEIGKK